MSTKSSWSGLPYLLRALAAALSALSLSWGIARTEGLIAAMIGAAAGTLCGARFARGKLRLSAIIGGLILFLISGLGLVAFSTSTSFIPQSLGPALTLRIAGVLRFSLIAFSIAALLRTIAARKPSASALELGFVSVSITTVFAAHRDGLIARPLWLSDWAFRNDFDPAHILLAIGVLAAGILAILQLAENKSERRISSLILLLLAAITVALGFNAIVLNPSSIQSNLGLSDQNDSGADGSDGNNGQSPSDDGDDDGGEDIRPPPLFGPDGGGGLDGGQAPMPFSLDGGLPPIAPTPINPNFSDGGIPVRPTDGGLGDGGFFPDRSGDGGSDDTSGGDGGTTDGGQNDGDGGSSSSNSLDQLENPDDSTSNTSAPMAIVLLENDYSPPSQAYYFREDALSQYNGTRLVKSTVRNTDTDVPHGFPHDEIALPNPLLTTDRSPVSTTVVLIADHSQPFALETPIKLFPKTNPNPSRFKRAYRVESQSQSVDYKSLIGRNVGNPAWTPETQRHYTEPPQDRRFILLARAIASALPEKQRKDPFSTAVAIKLFLDREVSYSTAAKHAGAKDPTADMLFGDKIGYCVHFAHAAVYLWRSLGIPARIGVGYHVEEDARRGGSAMLIRDGDAHAWPELYIDGAGWIILDIAPQRNLDPPRTPVDDELQRLLGEMARGQDPGPGEPPIQKGEIRKILRLAGMFLMLFVAAALILLYCIKIYRRLLPYVSPAHQMHIAAYRTALDRLTESGCIRHYGESRERFAERIKAIAPSFDELTWMHLRIALGKPNTNEYPSKEKWRQLLSQISLELRQNTKFSRRMLGLLHPASFLDSK